MAGLLREPLLALSRSARVKGAVTTAPGTRTLVARYVPGETAADAVRAAASLADHGIQVTLDYLGEDVTDRAQADATLASYTELLVALQEAGLAAGADLSLKLSAVGQALADSGEKVALDNARVLCRAARNAGATVTLDMEDHTTTESTLRVLRELRQDFPETGAVLQAYLRRTEADARDLAFEGSRVRLCKGAYDEPASVAFSSSVEVDRSYVRCLRILMEGQGYPMVATHDPRLITIAAHLAQSTRRPTTSYEFQMLYGIRPGEQHRLVEAGERVRVYIPYGVEWYGYLMRRMAERPSNLALFVRSLASSK